MGVFRKPFIRPYKTHRWIGTKAAGGAIERTAIDSLTLSDNITRLGTFLRTATDALGLSDAVTRIGTFLRAVSDSVTLSDSVSAVKVLIRTTTDALSLSDAVTRTGTFLRSVSDAITLSDTVTRTGTFLRDTSDALSLSDAVTALKVIVRSATDALSLSDAAARTGTFLRSVTDSVTLSDAATRIKTSVRTVTDSISFSESVVGTLGAIQRFATDALGLADSVTRSGTFFRAISDAISLGESVIRGINGVFGSIIPAFETARKHTRLYVQTVRRQPPMSAFKRTRTKLDQARFDDTAWGLSGIGDIMGEGSGNLGPLPDLGDLEIVIDATCDDPKYIIIIDDPNDPAPTPDSYAANNTIYEELKRVGNEFDPTFNVMFYRAVWFDGLEAYDPTHYDVGPTGNVIPVEVLADGTIVTAQYIKAN